MTEMWEAWYKPERNKVEPEKRKVEPKMVAVRFYTLHGSDEERMNTEAEFLRRISHKIQTQAPLALAGSSKY